MKLEDILLEHGRRDKIGKLELNASGVCSLVVNETCVVSFEKSLDGKGFFIYAVVGELPVEKEKEPSIMALIGNLFGKETGKANLGYAPHNHSLVLFEHFEEEYTDFFSYYHKFEEFIGYLAYWINKLEKSDVPAGATSTKELSFEKHVHDLPSHRNMNIFFA
jgi:hypothetical protein